MVEPDDEILSDLFRNHLEKNTLQRWGSLEGIVGTRGGVPLRPDKIRTTRPIAGGYVVHVDFDPLAGPA
jgi:hypothetical protein